MSFQDIYISMQEGFSAMTWREGIAVIFGLASVWYSKQENILVYPTGLVSTLIYVWICLEVGLYADMGINAYYFVMSIYGWYAWTRPTANGSSPKITWNTPKENLIAIVLLVSSYAVLYWLLSTYTDSDVPYWDSFTTASAFVGMWLMAKKKVENWIAWIITDLVSVPLYAYKNLWLTSFQFLVFTGLAIWGLDAWIKSARQANTNHA